MLKPDLMTDEVWDCSCHEN